MELAQGLVAVNFKYIELFHVKFGIGINYNLFTDVPFEFGYEQIFFTQKKFGDLRIDSERQSLAIHIMRIPQNLTENVITDGLSGYQISFSITIKARFTKNPGQRLSGSFAGHLNQTHIRNGENVSFTFIFFQRLLEGIKDFFLIGLIIIPPRSLSLI